MPTPPKLLKPTKLESPRLLANSAAWPIAKPFWRERGLSQNLSWAIPKHKSDRDTAWYLPGRQTPDRTDIPSHTPPTSRAKMDVDLDF